MREILFRGKREDNGKWVEGYYGQFHNRPIHKGENSHQIFVLMEDATGFGSMIGGLWHEVVPETVGQYTGLIDKNGTKIFEGDIVRLHINDQYYRSLICYSGQSCRFTVKTKLCGCWRHYPLNDRQQLNVIGNIHDNPELLKETMNYAR